MEFLAKFQEMRKENTRNTMRPTKKRRNSKKSLKLLEKHKIP